MSVQTNRIPLLDLWRRPAFRWLAVTAVFSYLGDQLYLVALPWLALQLTGSSLALGTVLMAAALPRAVFILVGGALSDRLTPRRVMLFSSGVSALVTGGFAILLALAAIQLWHLYAVAILLGLIDAVFYPAARSMLPLVLPRSQLAAGNAVASFIAQSSMIIGPGIAGMVVALSLELAFLLSAFVSVLSVGALWLLKPPQEQMENRTAAAASAAETPTRSLAADIAEGLRYAWRDPAIRNLLFLVAALSLALQGPLIVGGGLLANERFGGAIGFGILLSGWGLGGLIGAATAGSLNTIRQQGRLLLAVSLVFGISISAVGFTVTLPIAAVVMGLMGFCEGFLEVQIFTWLQTCGDPRSQGRLMSLITFASVGLEPFSYGFAGLLGQFNPAMLFLSAGALIFAAVAVAACSRDFRRIGLSPPADEASYGNDLPDRI